MEAQDQKKQEERQKFQDLVKQTWHDKWVEINGTRYTLTTVPHKKHLKIVGFFNRYGEKMANIIGSDEWNAHEDLLNSIVTVDNQAISKIPNFWESHQADYFTFMLVVTGAYNVPFSGGLLS